jgi:hypothetical protein
MCRLSKSVVLAIRLRCLCVVSWPTPMEVRVFFFLLFLVSAPSLRPTSIEVRILLIFLLSSRHHVPGQLQWRSEYSSPFSFSSQHHLSGQLQWRFAYSSSSISLLGSIPGPSMRYPSLPRLSTSSRPTPMEDRVFFLLLCLDTLFLPHLVFGNIVASGYPTQDPLSPYEYSNRRKRKSPALLDLRNWGYTPSTE